jgi:hypothetical protein
MKIYNPVINNNDVNTIDNAKEAIYSKGRYAYWAPYITTDPSGMGATYTATSPVNQGENGIRLTDLTSAGQSAMINWSSSNVDWTRDFRVQASVYLSNPAPTFIMGDGFVIHMGATSPSPNIYANTADNALKFRIFTFGGAANQTIDPAGAAFFVGSTKGPQGKLGNTSFVANVWIRWTIEVCRDKVTGKRIAAAYFDYDGAAGDYSGRFNCASMDVTSWVPTGTNFGFFCSTGGARSEQYLNSILFEAL